jgi:hypothetical protein
MILNVILYGVIRTLQNYKNLCLSWNMNIVKCVRLAVVFELHKEMISQHFSKHPRCCLNGVWGRSVMGI